jgi:hypothetical protein
MLNTYSYARLNPVAWIDPSGLVACPGGEWSQDIGDFGAYIAFGGYLRAPGRSVELDLAGARVVSD